MNLIIPSQREKELTIRECFCNLLHGNPFYSLYLHLFQRSHQMTCIDLLQNHFLSDNHVFYTRFRCFAIHLLLFDGCNLRKSEVLLDISPFCLYNEGNVIPQSTAKIEYPIQIKRLFLVKNIEKTIVFGGCLNE